MKLSATVLMKLKVDEVLAEVKGATQGALKKVIVNIANDAIHGSPYLTGNNARSIQYEAEGLTGSIFSTSGYGGFLETGTVNMAARPYFKPALDRHIQELPEGIKAELK